MDRIKIFDTTLRDGEQSPGFSMNVEEKLRMARQLERLQVDIIEAGFPIASEGDFEAVKKISAEIRSTTIAGLARAVPADIDRCWQALEGAARPRIHTFLATSDIHLKYKFNKTRGEALDIAVKAVERARKLCDEVEFSAEDAGRTEINYLCTIFDAVIEAGATIVNVPDTVGYQTPAEYGQLIRTLRERLKNADRIIISTHCHDDLGLAVANSLAAIENGARQVECAINGIGERAGNAALEEIVMALDTRKRYYDVTTGVRTEELYRSSRLLCELTGKPVQVNKAIVGENAFAHEAGIHQDGVLKNTVTYEIMSPERVGVPRNMIVLGKHSGRHALEARYRELGYTLSREQIDKVYVKFLELADRKKRVDDPKYDHLPPGKKCENGLLDLRKLLGNYANLRPVTVFEALVDSSPLRRDSVRGVDLMIVRELLGGIYFGSPRGIEESQAFNTEIYTREEVRRGARLAFKLARHRRRRVTSVDKANVLEVSVLWRETCTEVSKQFPDVAFQSM